MLQTTVVGTLVLVLCISLSHASSHGECSFSIMEIDQDQFTFLTPSALAMNIVQCNCSNDSQTVEIILPDGSVAVDSASIAVMSSPGSVSINAKMADLGEGIYTCRIDGDDTFYLYLLDPSGLSLPNPSAQCSSSEGGGVTLFTQLEGHVPEDFMCYENGELVDVHPQFVLDDRLRPTSTNITVEFDPPTESTVQFMCNSTSGLSSFMVMCTLTGITVPTTDNTTNGTNTTALEPPPLQAGNTAQIGSGDTAIAPLSQLDVSQVTATSPLWCQGASVSDTVSWTLPDGTILMHNSMDTASVGIVPSSDSNNVGIVPVGMNSFPAGVYTCTVNNQPLLVEVGSNFMVPALDERRCAFTNNQVLTILASISGGIPSVVSCTPTPTQSVVVKNEFTDPLTTLLAIEFNPAVAGQTYTCSIMNDQGRGPTFSCSVLENPTDLTAVRDEDDPSVVTFSWQVPASANSEGSQITGYNLTLTSPNGTVIRSVSISGPNVSSVTVDDLDFDQPISASIVSVSDDDDGVAPGPVSPSTMAELARLCKPGSKFDIEVCLERPLNEGEESGDDMCAECADATFAQTAFNTFLQNGCIDSTKCFSPAISNTECECKRQKGRKKGRKGRKGSKSNDDDDDDVGTQRICLDGELFCTSCETYEAKGEKSGSTSGGRRRDGRDLIQRRLKRKPNKRNSDLFDSDNCTTDLTVGGVSYSIEDKSVKIKEKRGDYCGMTKLMKPAKSCECPDVCDQQPQG